MKCLQWSVLPVHLWPVSLCIVESGTCCSNHGRCGRLPMRPDNIHVMHHYAPKFSSFLNCKTVKSDVFRTLYQMLFCVTYNIGINIAPKST